MYISQLIAADSVHQVFAGRNLTLSLPAALSLFPAATPQQKGAAADLSYGTLRFYGEIDAYLTQLLEKPLTDERIHALLLVAIYQLLHDKADAFTVVNQAVHAVSQLKRPAPKSWAKGLVNAILRNFLRQKDQLTAKLKTNEVATFSYPQWWINKLRTQYPTNWQSILETGNQHPPMTLRVNTKKISIDEYLQLLARQDIEATILREQAIVLTKPVPVEKIPGFADGVVSVQDYGAQLAAYLLDAQSNMKVLDACCAPGGKTGHILERADVQMTALDNDELRLQRVQSNLTRLNLQANLLVGDASSTDWYDGKPFDRILADVPCTASGIVRRHVDIIRAKEEIFTKDRLVPTDESATISFVPHAPDTEINGRIINIYGGVAEAGPESIVSISRGSADGLEVGHVLAINRYGRVIKDPEPAKEKNDGTATKPKLKELNFDVKRDADGKAIVNFEEQPKKNAAALALEPGMIKLPDERIGLLMVFRVFDRVSYALVMQASLPINKLDSVRTP